VDATRTHLYVLLDRSGSMEAIRDDVIGGFNAYLAAQRADGPDALMTLVQFDSHDPHEVMMEAVPVAEVLRLDRATFRPRGGTPLLDATGLVIGTADVRADELRRHGVPPEAIVVTTITDGHENQSREFDRPTILGLIQTKEAEGWSFVFLSAGPDAYAEAGGIGYDPRSVQAWAPSSAGAQAAFASLSRATATRRQRIRRGETHDRGDFFEGQKEAEADRWPGGE
jgi:hypothetical protein